MTTLVQWSGSDHPASALVCIPWAGAGAAPFRAWASMMPPEITLLAARLPGRESRAFETPLRDITQVVALLATELESLGLPEVAIFGQCSGAVIGFEVARELRRRATTRVSTLFVASQAAPGTLKADADDSIDVRETLRMIGGTPEAVLANDELLEILRPAIEADAHLVRGYCYLPEPRLSAHVWAISGDLEANGGAAMDLWGQETSGRFGRLVVPGGHLFAGSSWMELGALLVAHL